MNSYKETYEPLENYDKALGKLIITGFIAGILFLVLLSGVGSAVQYNVTANNAGDIRTQLGNCGNTQCIIHIPTGNYNIDSLINLTIYKPYSSLTIEGEGQTNTIINVTNSITGTGVFYGEDIGNIEFRNFAIQGNNLSDSGIRLNANVGSSYVKIINITSNKNKAYGVTVSKVTNLYISGTTTNNNTGRSDGEGRGIFISQNTNVYISNCIANYNRRYGIVTHTSYNERITNCTTNYNLGDRGVYEFNSYYTQIDNHYSEGNNFAGITIEGQLGTILNSTTTLNTLDGVLFRDSGSPYNQTRQVEVTNVNSSNNLRFGIYVNGVDNLDNNKTIYNYILRNNIISKNGDSGIKADNFENGLIEYNNIINNKNTTYGIYFTAGGNLSCKDTKVRYNNISLNNAGSGSQGIRLGTNACSNNIIYGNNITGYLTQIYDGDGSRGTIFGVQTWIPSLSNGLTHYYKFENDTFVLDQVGTYNLTSNGTVLLDSGKILNSTFFNGTASDYMNTSSLYSEINMTGNFTLSFWFYPNTTSQGHPFAQTVDTNNRFDVTTTSSSVKIGFINSSSYAWGNKSGSITVDSWNHLVYSYDNGSAVLYVNGVLQTSVGAVPAGKLCTLCVYFGRSASTAEPFKGKIDEFGIWNRTLNSSESQNLYNSGSSLIQSNAHLTINNLDYGTNRLNKTFYYNISLLALAGRSLSNFTLFNSLNLGSWSSINISSLSGTVYNFYFPKQYNYNDSISQWNGQLCVSDGDCIFDWENRSFNIIYGGILTNSYFEFSEIMGNPVLSWLNSTNYESINNSGILNEDIKFYGVNNNSFIYNTKGNVFGSKSPPYNNGNFNFSLVGESVTYILPNFNVTEGVTRQFSPISVSGTSTSKTITSTLSQSVNATVIISVPAKCPSGATFEGNGYSYNSCDGNTVVYSLNNIPNGNSILSLSFAGGTPTLNECDAKSSLTLGIASFGKLSNIAPIVVMVTIIVYLIFGYKVYRRSGNPKLQGVENIWNGFITLIMFGSLAAVFALILLSNIPC